MIQILDMGQRFLANLKGILVSGREELVSGRFMDHSVPSGLSPTLSENKNIPEI